MLNIFSLKDGILCRLWDLLLKYVNQSHEDICIQNVKDKVICLSDAKDSTIASPWGSDGDKDSTISGLNNFVDHGSGNNDVLQVVLVPSMKSIMHKLV